MKRELMLLVAGLVSGVVCAEEPAVLQTNESNVSVSAAADFYSAYVWRGQILSDHAVVQPSVTAAKGPFSLNVWGNWNAGSDRDVTDGTEVDYTFAYALPIDSDHLTMEAGLIYYTFPGSGNEFRSTEEVFLTAALESLLFTPTATVYYDIDEVNGWYGTLGLSQVVEIGDALTAEAGVSAGYGSRNYNRFAWGEENGSGAVNDYNAYLSAEYALTDKLSIGARLQYTVLDNGTGNDAREFQNDNILWGGVSLSCQFL